VLLFAAGLTAGLCWPDQFTGRLTTTLKGLKDLADLFHSLHHPWLAVLLLFLHNLLSSALMVVLGFFFGIYPAWAMWMNGLLAGYVLAEEAHRGLAAWQLFVYGMLPHGIFEIPAFIWAAALGLELGFTVLQTAGDALAVRMGRRVRAPQGRIRDAFRRIVRKSPYIAALLLVAACVEGLVTPHVLWWGLHLHTVI
jgi:stage II sporulation protein M